MREVKVYNKEGTLIESVPICTNLNGLVGHRRVWLGDDGLYYKGAGITYTYHNVRELSNDLICLGENSSIVYGGYAVRDIRYLGLTGIICTPYQPYFKDYIGGCGPKEYRIVENSKNFELSGVEVKDIISVIDNHNIYVCDYKAKEGLESHSPSANSLIELLDYISQSSWCCPWDKNTYRDIDGLGYLRDPADWFTSDEFDDKFGTIYSILYSLYKTDKSKYVAIINKLQFKGIPINSFTIPYVCLLILYSRGYDITGELMGNYDSSLYKNIIVNHLLNAKYCCQLEDSEGYYKDVKSLMVNKFYEDIGGE